MYSLHLLKTCHNIPPFPPAGQTVPPFPLLASSKLLGLYFLNVVVPFQREGFYFYYFHCLPLLCNK